MRTHDLPARAREIGAIMHARLTDLQEQFAVIADLRGRGAMMAIELCTPGTRSPTRPARPPWRRTATRPVWSS